MDAVSVILQLKRIALGNNITEDILAKLPRVIIGLSYFLEHPDIGVKREAAKALIMGCKLHLKIIIESAEVTELKKNLMMHTSSMDVFVKNLCLEALEILEKNNKPDVESSSEEIISETTMDIKGIDNKLSVAVCPAQDSINQFEKYSIKFGFKLSKLTDQVHSQKLVDNEVEEFKKKIFNLSGLISVTYIQPEVCSQRDDEEYLNQQSSIIHRTPEEERIDALITSSKPINDQISTFNSQTLLSNLKYCGSQKKDCSDTLLSNIIADVIMLLPIDFSSQKKVISELSDDFVIFKIRKIVENCDKSTLNESNTSEYPDFNPATILSDTSLTEPNESNSQTTTVDQFDCRVSPKYLDEKEYNTEDDKLSNFDANYGSLFNGWRVLGKTSSLFSSGSNESKFLSEKAIIPNGNDAKFVDKLRRVKEKRAANRLNSLKKQSTLDRVIENFSTIKFW